MEESHSTEKLIENESAEAANSGTFLNPETLMISEVIACQI
jgi:hypothetical protein